MVNRKRDRMAPVQDEILERLRAGPASGMTINQLRPAMGRTGSQLEQTLSKMLTAGRLWVIYAKPRSRYYPSVEAMEAARPQVEAEEAAIRKAVRDAARAREAAAKRERCRAARADKPARVKAVKPEKPAASQAKAHCWGRVASDASTRTMPSLPQKVPVPRRPAAPKGPAVPAEVVGMDDAMKRCEPAKKYPDHRFVVDGPVVGGFATMGVGRYMEPT